MTAHRFRRILPVVLGAMLVATSCGGAEEPATTVAPPVTATSLPPVTTTAPSTSTTSTATAAPSTTVPSTTTSSSSTTTTMPPVTTVAPTLPPIAVGTLVSIPVGSDGIEYSGSGNEQEINGPSLLAADPSGGVHFYDPMGRRILSFNGAGQTEIDTAALDITSLTALAATADHLIVVEIFFQPVRNRVHRISFEGSVIETIELPVGFRLEDGLSGVRTDGAGRIILEFAGGSAFGVWNGPDTGFEMLNVLAIDGITVTPRPPDLDIDGVLLTADLATGLGSLRYLATDPDGSIVVERQDVLALDPVVRVLTSIEWYSPNGALLGAARVPPLEEQYISTPPAVAVLPDGRAVALVALQDEVRIEVLERRPERITK